MTRIAYVDARDGVQLAYQYHPGKGPTLVFLPGYASHMSGSKATTLADWAARAGRASLLFDYGGCGLSSGDFEAQSTWYFGLAAESCVRVLTLTDDGTARLVIDIEH